MNVWVEVNLGMSASLRNHAGAVVAGATSELLFFGGEDPNGNLDTTYKTNYTSSTCTAGHAQVYCADNNDVVCEPCLAGEFSNSGDYACTACPSGSYSMDTTLA